MSSFFDSGPLPDWKDIQQLLGKEIPWNLANNWERVGDSNWLNQYVNDMLIRKKSEAQVQDHSEVVRVDVTKETARLHVHGVIRGILRGPDSRGQHLVLLNSDAHHAKNAAGSDPLLSEIHFALNASILSVLANLLGVRP
jgi:hypothetical protein